MIREGLMEEGASIQPSVRHLAPKWVASFCPLKFLGGPILRPNSCATQEASVPNSSPTVLLWAACLGGQVWHCYAPCSLRPVISSLDITGAVELRSVLSRCQWHTQSCSFLMWLILSTKKYAAWNERLWVNLCSSWNWTEIEGLTYCNKVNRVWLYEKFTTEIYYWFHWK